jgi:aromatic ring-opening dioxygenase catalytic subunit (LigB family)
LIVSAHWESAPLALSAPAAGTPLIYDFSGFGRRYFAMTYQTPDATALAAKISALMSDTEPVHEHPSRGLDHGAWVPLKVMYPYADVPVLQLSMPTHDPDRLFRIGQQLQPLREEGVLIIGSGYMTHGLPFLGRDSWERNVIPGWSRDFDAWAAEALAAGRIDVLADFRARTRDAVRTPNGGALHADLRHLWCGDRSLGTTQSRDRRLSDGPGEAVLPGRVTATELEAQCRDVEYSCYQEISGEDS